MDACQRTGFVLLRATFRSGEASQRICRSALSLHGTSPAVATDHLSNSLATIHDSSISGTLRQSQCEIVARSRALAFE